MAFDATVDPCPQCGFVTRLSSRLDVVYPWRLHSRSAVADYVQSLSDETHEWLLALYVSENFDLLSIETVAKGSTTDCPVDFRKIVCRGLNLGAAGFFLVHNHPSGDATPSRPDRLVTVQLAQITRALDMPLIEHFIVGSDRMISVLME